jgi:hypothetical protein
MPDDAREPSCTDHPDVDRLTRDLFSLAGDLRMASDAGHVDRLLLIDLYECLGRRLGVDGFPARRVEGGGLRPVPPPVPAPPSKDVPHAFLWGSYPYPPIDAGHACTDCPTDPAPIPIRMEAGGIIPAPADYADRIAAAILSMPARPEEMEVLFPDDDEPSDDYPLVTDAKRLNDRRPGA